ncbi:uncharacterized protein LOC111692594 [Anoplophora glabripennis]|uniref:uncharacterized protein LOC111692594 n=1 Tax=Anoplophora glabripennis TaxID=217634 RepID=UPI000C77ABC0|nr:uncharacterized protein LOC111692594 [Anoplophora glabripennis]
MTAELRSAKKVIHNEELEQLINNVCNTFVNKLEVKFDKKFAKLNDKLSEVTDSIKGLNESVKSNKQEIQSVITTTKYLELSNKRNTLRFHGDPETESESDLNSLLSIIGNTMKVRCVQSDVDFLYRLGKSTESNRPRSIIVNFVTNIKRNEVYAAKRLLKNSDISIFEDLPKNQYELLLQAKKKYGKRDAWTSGGKVYVLRNNKRCVINSINDL